MSEENFCNNGECKINRRGEKHPMHIIDKKMNDPLKKFDEKYKKWIQNLSTKHSLLFILGLSAIMIGIATYLVDKIFNENNFPRPDNLHTIVIEIGIGVTIALVIWAYSTMQQNTMRKLVNDIKKIVKKEDENKEEIKQDVSLLLNRRLHTTIRALKRSLGMYENYSKESDPEKKQNYWKIFLNNYDHAHERLDLKLDLLKLMEIYGRATARQYWELLSDLQITSNNFFFGMDEKDEESAFASHITDCLKKSENLKKIIEPLSSQIVKSKDLSSSKENTKKDSENS